MRLPSGLLTLYNKEEGETMTGKESQNKKERFEEMRREVAPLAKQFLEDPAMFERLKAVSPGLTEEYLLEMLRKTVGEEKTTV